MAFDFRRPPVDILHMPTVHQGVSYLGEVPDWIIRSVPAAPIRMFAESDHPQMRARQQAVIKRQFFALPMQALEVRSAPVVLQNARFAHGMVQVDGRFWLNGASGSRVRTKFENANPEPWRRQRYADAFRRCWAKGTAMTPVRDLSGAKDLSVAIELKNGFNYYHYSTETLGSLAHFVQDESEAPITLHLPTGPIKGFVKRFVDAVFPSLADRVRFEQNSTRYKEVRSVYSHQHFLYSVNDPSVAAVLDDQDLDPRWPAIARNPVRIKPAAMMSYDMNLRLLREAALAQVPQTARTTPKLIWMGRDEGGEARARGIDGHQPLLEELIGLGFEQIAFEHLSPLEQIAAMNGADVLIAPHGAGLANMIYAKPDATVIEIGTRQTQLHRWGDFLKCAHVSRCRYDTVFADIEGIDDLAIMPKMSDGHRGVKVSRNATDRIISIVTEALNRTSAGDGSSAAPARAIRA